jgi:hypothetical protein
MSKNTIKKRLEYLRGELNAERISTGELCELQSLAAHIEPDDVQLLEAAGVPEHPAEPDFKVFGGGTLYMVQPLNDCAKDHLESHVGEDAIYLGPSLAVEHRYIDDLVAGLRQHGFKVI